MSSIIFLIGCILWVIGSVGLMISMGKRHNELQKKYIDGLSLHTNQYLKPISKYIEDIGKAD